jgi:hypothetical protein
MIHEDIETYERWKLTFHSDRGQWIAAKAGVEQLIYALTRERIKIKIHEFNETGVINE